MKWHRQEKINSVKTEQYYQMLIAHASESEVIFSLLKLSPKRCVEDIFRKSDTLDE